MKKIPCSCGRFHANMTVTINCMRQQIHGLQQRTSPVESSECNCPEFCLAHGRRRYDALFDAFIAHQDALNAGPHDHAEEKMLFDDFFRRVEEVFTKHPEEWVINKA